MVRRSFAVALLSGLLFVSGVASAQWLAAGSGAGYAKARTPQALTSVDVASSTVADLYPGGTGDLQLRIANPNVFDVTVSAVTGAGDISSDVGACDDAGHGVTYTDQTGLAIRVPSGGQVSTTFAGSVTMAETSADACAGATFTIPVTLSGYVGRGGGGAGGGGGGADADGDGIADSEDCAPDFPDASPDDGICHALVSVYALKRGEVASGTVVDLHGVAVTAATPDGGSVWVQVPPEDAGYAGPEHSGVRVRLATSAPGSSAANERVDLTASWDGTSLSSASVRSVGPGTLLVPATVDASVTDWPSRYDGVLVTFFDEEVGSQAATGFETTTGYVVDDLLMPGLLGTYPDGAQLSSVTGVFDGVPSGDVVGYLHPRSDGDIVRAT